MERFTNILFCPLGAKDSRAIAKRVVDLAVGNGAQLTLLGVIPEPTRWQRLLHRDAVVDAVQEEEREAAAARLAQMFSKTDELDIDSRIAVGSAALEIIERVLSAEHDLVIVTSDDDDEDHATIKRLLRKCPCPVWVIRPTRARTQRVLAAVNSDPAESELNATILELAASMVELHGGELHVVHAWQLYGESTMRSSAFIHVSHEEVAGLLNDERSTHRDALTAMLAATDVDEQRWNVHLRKGAAADIVREVVDEFKINLLVMGTVARTGVPGLIMGNTAESVLDDVRCSVIAVKPPGFISPMEIVAR